MQLVNISLSVDLRKLEYKNGETEEEKEQLYDSDNDESYTLYNNEFRNYLLPLPSPPTIDSDTEI